MGSRGVQKGSRVHRAAKALPSGTGMVGDCPSQHRKNRGTPVPQDCPHFQHLPEPPSGSIIHQKDLQNSLKSAGCGVLQEGEAWGRMWEGTKLLSSPSRLCTARSPPIMVTTHRVGAPHPLPRKLTEPVTQSLTGAQSHAPHLADL